MMAVLRFRLIALLIAIFVGGISFANLAAEFLRPASLPLAPGNSTPTPEQLSAAARAAAIAPFRSDLVSDHALALAGQALKPDVKGGSEEAKASQNAIKSALGIGPHRSRVWLVLALLQARSSPAEPLMTESLKMSYLTGPNQADIVPIRLAAVTASNALNDSELGELARSDVRAILTRLPEQRPTLVNAYARASDLGKKFLEASVATVDPKFVDQIRKR